MDEQLIFVAEAVTDDAELHGRPAVSSGRVFMDMLLVAEQRLVALERRLSDRQPSLSAPRGAA